MTTNYVLAEYVALAHVRGVPRWEIIKFSSRILDDKDVEIIWVDENLHRQAVALLRERADKTYSLCDAASFVIMRERGIAESLTAPLRANIFVRKVLSGFWRNKIMRRTAFYLSVALLAFGFGSFVVFKFYLKRVEQRVITQTREVNKSEIKEQVQTLTQETSEVDGINYEEKAAFEVLRPTIKKWLRGGKVKSERNDITFELIKEVAGKSESELNETEKHFWQDLGFEFTPYLIDVNGDGKNELAILNSCAPVGNCKFWLFRKSGNGYETILETSYGAVQTFKLKPSKTNGYFDLETKDHGSSTSGGIEIYKFNGNNYKVSECYDYNYSYLKDDKVYKLKKPRITLRKCYEE